MSASSLTDISNNIKRQLGAAYLPYHGSSDAHARMLDRVTGADDVAVMAQPSAGGAWTVTTCSPDWLGSLALIAGLFTSYLLDIISVDAFTVAVEPEPEVAPRPRRRRRGGSRPRRRGVQSRPRLSRKALNIFEANPSEELPPDVWERFQDDLRQLFSVAAHDGLEAAHRLAIERFSNAMRGAGEGREQLMPVNIDIDPEGADGTTVLSIESQDTRGFLFAFTTALASLKINIVRADVRTVGGTVRDTFWLTDASGAMIASAEELRELRAAAALIKHFTHLLPRSSNPQMALRQFSALIRQVLSRSDWTGEVGALESPEVLETLAEVMGVSQFLWEDFLRMQHESLFPVLVDTSSLDQTKSSEHLRATLSAQLRSASDDQAAVRYLNRFKDREMFRIDLRHITGRVDFVKFAGELTALTGVVVAAAVELVEGALKKRYGPPRLPDGSLCKSCVCALGKFGGREMGFGSDIELIFIYEAEGETDGPEKVMNSTYFGELVKGFLQTLHARREGIFHVDLRLRPYGSKGALASSLGAFKAYYSTEGDARQFERLALVKLRPVAGHPHLAHRVMAARDHFVYSNDLLDPDEIQSIRRRQASELVEPMSVNVKHSLGGMVDIEYYVQASQIAAGRDDPSVRGTNTLDAVRSLAARGHMPADLAGEIRRSYSFLRILIDALRVVRGNAKDLAVPDQDSREFRYLAQRLRFESPAELADAISGCMECARGVWDRETVPA